MAKIPLRVYNREIENLIERGQTDEALARCKQILQIFPKYIEAYRLLGKAYLESQRYTEASDVFQRLLSTVPDDFVAHVGMSIIKEDEGNIDEAIWHMERATEIQPSNTAVQDELRRLFARREGMEPSRLRMTRGGLVRMYARGDLYQQAITEALAALDEDPQRTDIQVLLARMYNLTGQRVKAAEVCGDLLVKLPYCFEANWIMYEILPPTARAEEGKVYLERVCEIDPYTAYISNDQMATSDVPDNAILIERLEWDPTQAITSQPDWASNLGIQIDQKEPKGHVLPDWLASLSPIPVPPPGKSITPDQTSENPSIEEQVVANMENDTENQEQSSSSSQSPVNKASGASNLPEWMQDAGWEINNQPHNQELSAFRMDDVEKDVPDAIPATEIPEWLKPLAPVESEPVDAPEEIAPAAELDGLSWVQALASTPTDANQPAGETDGMVEFPADVVLPLQDDTVSETAVEQPVESQETQVGEPVISEVDQPAISEMAFDSAAPTQEPIPDWLKGLEDGSDQAGQGSVPALIADQPFTTETPSILNIDDQAGMMDWLEDIAIHHTAEAQTVISHPEDRISKPPSWVNRIDEESTIAQGTDIPDWLQGLDEATFPVLNQETDKVADQPAEETPEWLTSYRAPALEQPVAEVERNPIFESDSPLTPGALEMDKANTSPERVEPVVEALSIIEPHPFVEESLPDWLILLSQEPLEEVSTPAEMAGQPVEPVNQPEIISPGLDWEGIDQVLPEESPESALLTEISEPSELETESKASTPAVESLDWLSAFQAEPRQDLTSISEETSQPIASDWQPEMPEENASPAESSLSDSLAEPALPDWLKMLEEPSQDLATPDQTVHDQSVPDTAEAESYEPPAASIESENTVVSETLTSSQEPELPETPLWEDQPKEAAPTLETLEPELQAFEIPIPGETATQETAIQPEPVQEFNLPVEESTEELPEWLRGFESSIQIPTAPEEVAQVEELTVETEPVPEVPVAQLDTPGEVESEQPVEPELVPVQEVTNPPSQEPIPVQFVEEVSAEPIPEWLEGYLKETEKTVEGSEEQDVDIYEPQVAEQPVEFAAAVPSFSELENKASASEPSHIAALAVAQAALNSGNLSQALESYNGLIQSGTFLEDTIHDLRDSLYRYPVDPLVWQSLGDAYLRMNQIQDALDAYTKAEELIR